MGLWISCQGPYSHRMICMCAAHLLEVSSHRRTSPGDMAHMLLEGSLYESRIRISKMKWRNYIIHLWCTFSGYQRMCISSSTMVDNDDEKTLTVLDGTVISIGRTTGTTIPLENLGLNRKYKKNLWYILKQYQSETTTYAHQASLSMKCRHTPQINNRAELISY